MQWFVEYSDDNKNIIELGHGWQRSINDKLEFRARYRMNEMIEGLQTLTNLNYKPTQIDNIFIELNVNGFETGDDFNSPYLTNIQTKDARLNMRLNSYNKRVRRRKFGSMVMF